MQLTSTEQIREGEMVGPLGIRHKRRMRIAKESVRLRIVHSDVVDQLEVVFQFVHVKRISDAFGTLQISRFEKCFDRATITPATSAGKEHVARGK